MNDIRPIVDYAPLASRAATADRARALAPTCRGLNYHAIDGSLRGLLPLYMEERLLAPVSYTHLTLPTIYSV